MLKALIPLSKYLKLKNVRIYDLAFVLHSKVSVSILLTCTLLVSARQYFGQPIECMSSEKQLDFINLFCWTMGTFIVTGQGDTRLGKGSIAVGVGTEYPGSERVYLRYYQWVVMILLMQSVLFCLPGFIWKTWEGGLMGELCTGLERNAMVFDKESDERRAKLLKFLTSDYSRVHRGYSKKYFVCEVLNFAICILNLAMMNLFFNGFWSNYSHAMSRIPSYNWDRWNEMSSRVFPKLAKCEFFKFGASGSTMKYDALCVLPLNILNEKIFAFLYVWFLLLMVVSAAHLTFRVIVVCSTSARIILTQCSVGCNQRKQVRQLLEDMGHAEWFLLMRVAQNVNPVMYDDLIRELCELQKLKYIEMSV